MSGISEHLYGEMMKIMDRKPIRDAITRQEPIVRQWISDSIESAGVDQTSELIEDLISMNEIYEGSRPVINQLIDFAIELDANDIQRGSSQFHGQVMRAGDYGSLDTFYQQGNEIIPIPSPDRQPEHINKAEDEVKIPEHPLRKSWDAVVARYQDAELSGDTFAMESAERTLDRLRAQIESAPLAKATPEPVKAPDTPVQAPDDGMQARSDELDRRLDALPDHDNYTPEQQRELDSIVSYLDKIDEDYPDDEDYTNEDYA